MGKVRGELEDLAFQYLEPDAYREIVASMETRRHSNQEFLDEIRQTLEAECGAKAFRRASRAASSAHTPSS